MDELPDLRSDADVDALMARIQARIAPASFQPAPSGSSRAVDTPSHDSFAAYAAAQEGFASAVLRALQVVAESLDELGLETAASPKRTERRTPARRTSTRRTRR